MGPLAPPPRIRLSRLRDIGWSLWDPIGLLDGRGRWDDDDNLSFADEYDTYLMAAAGMVRRGASDAEAAAYLVQIELDHMGLDEQPESHARAMAVVAAMRADAQLWSTSSVDQ